MADRKQPRCGAVVAYDTTTGELKFTLEQTYRPNLTPLFGEISFIYISPSGNTLISSNVTYLYVWDVEHHDNPYIVIPGLETEEIQESKRQKLKSSPSANDLISMAEERLNQCPSQ
jgi:hypothetical protein